MSSSNDWITVEKGVYVQYIKGGEGNYLDECRNGVIVKCSFKLFMFLDDGSRDADKRIGRWVELETRVLESFQIGESDLVKGLEVVFQKGESIRIGDKFRARIEAHLGYSDKGRPSIQLSNLIQAIPPGTDLEYLIEIADVEYPFPYPNAFTIDTAGKLSISKSTSSKEDDIPNSDMLSEVSVISFINLRKESGNRWFKFQNFDLAANAYGKGASIAYGFMKLKEGQDFDNKKMKSLYIACLNNLAACHISRGNMIRAKVETKKVLELDPINVKALLRSARASLAVQDWSDAQNCLETIMNSQKPNGEWYEFAVAEMNRLEKAKEKFQKDQSPEAKVINVAMTIVRNNTPKTPIEVLPPDISSKLKHPQPKRKTAYISFYIKWISFIIILFCSALILYIVFFDKEGLGLTVDDIIDCLTSMKRLTMDDIRLGIQKSLLKIKSIRVDDYKEGIIRVSSKMHNTINSINFEMINEKLIQLKTHLTYEKLQHTMLTLLEDMKKIDIDTVSTKAKETMQYIFGSKKIKEGIKPLTEKNIVDLVTVEELPITTFDKNLTFGSKLAKDAPITLLFTSLILAIGNNLRF